MKLSTLLELTGFALICATGWYFGTVPGLLVTAGVLLLLGYLLDDEQAVLMLRGTFVAPIRARQERHRARRAAVKAGEAA